MDDEDLQAIREANKRHDSRQTKEHRQTSRQKFIENDYQHYKKMKIASMLKAAHDVLVFVSGMSLVGIFSLIFHQNFLALIPVVAFFVICVWFGLKCEEWSDAP